MYDEAVVYYEKIMKDQPNDDGNQLSLGKCYLKKGDLAKAKGIFERIVASESGDAYSKESAQSLLSGLNKPPL
ncbi:MAG: tetratricopeptide repeat protein [Candidatus Omnitrophica bacterium]|nr:tetratricopeptide repeat protein [Candidatus Omnitrophota bacterium]MBU4488166.1 tetratricopeptide repeat protein [Candidatus Omnitrophota bacterium]